MKRQFFSLGGLEKFKKNLAKNICHASVNSESVVWLTLSAILSGKEDAFLDDLLLKGIENLYENPASSILCYQNRLFSRLSLWDYVIFSSHTIFVAYL